VQVGQRLSLVELSEVDAWTGFSLMLPSPNLLAGVTVCRAAAATCNIPLTDMARSTGLDYQGLLVGDQ
jgi:hypothetical protein